MTVQEFGMQPERDAEWEQECWRETVRSVLLTEHRAFSTNLLTILAIGIAASFMPNASAFVFPLIMRLLAAVGAHLSYRHLRRRMDLGQALDPPLRLLGVMLFFGGMSWGYLLLPLLVEPHLHPVRPLLVGGVLVGTALVITMTAPLRKQTLAFVAGFLVTPLLNETGGRIVCLVTSTHDGPFTLILFVGDGHRCYLCLVVCLFLLYLCCRKFWAELPLFWVWGGR